VTIDILLEMQKPITNYVNQWGKYGQGRIAVTAYVLGMVLALGFSLVIFSQHLFDFGLYMMLLSVFHLWEFLYVCIYRPKDLTAESFMVNHSKEFNLALLVSWVEYFVEWYFFPSLKGHVFLYWFGFLFCLSGQTFRTVAMITAGQNFNHLIEEEKKQEHTLVTYGVYSLVRHPSYTGWFIWSVATQVILFNPICIIAYTYVSWRFFQDRIAYEEMTLVHMFGNDYEKYKREVPSGIPFVK